MVRLAAVSAAMLSLSPAAAVAGQAAASFQVGITIGGDGQAVRSTPAGKTYTWGAAAISVNRAGFHAPEPLEKSDTLYWFTANRGGNSFRVAVSISSGKVTIVLPA